jgi:hypothetical protein
MRRAIYTRKSSGKGLEEEFNTLHGVDRLAVWT